MMEDCLVMETELTDSGMSFKSEILDEDLVARADLTDKGMSLE